jgi:hypothetical protein
MCVCGGNNADEATGEESADRNVSEGIEPRKFRNGEADSVHILEGSRARRVNGKRRVPRPGSEAVVC